MPTPDNIILGIDPGSRKMGYGVIATYGNQIQYLTSGCIQASQGSLLPLFKGLHAIICEYHPKEAAIEEVFLHRNFKSSLVLGQARGVALLALEMNTVKVTHYAARQIKKSVTGYGGAQKSQMQQMIQQLLHLSGLPGPDAADALGIAICHINHGE